MLILFNIQPKNDINTNNLLMLRNACISGLVNISKKEWDNMNYHDCMFLILLENKKQEKEINEMKRRK